METRNSMKKKRAQRGMMGENMPVEAQPMTRQQAAKPVNQQPEAMKPGVEPMTQGVPGMQQKGASQPEQPETQARPPIGVEELEKATARLLRYQRGKASLDRRIVANEEWWKLRHWRQLNARFGKKEEEQLEPASAWLLNCVLNKHADAMDNYPDCAVLPREQGDVALAETLSGVIPVIMEENRYEAVYDDMWWYKIKQGTGVQFVYWDAQKLGGLGDVGIKTVDILKLAWEPGVRDIQDSDDLFCVDVMTLEQFQARWPEFADEVQGGVSVTVQDYEHEDSREDSDRVAVIDWYYKRRNAMGKQVLHLCKYTGQTILFASENEERYRETGWYEHGLYPFVFDPLFPVQDSCAGFGYIDIMRDPQMYIDMLDSMILKNAQMCGKRRYFVSDQAGINEKEFADWGKDIVHVDGPISELNIREIDVSPLPAAVYNVRETKINELKETSGNRDFNQGGTSSGVTAASAIASLQEAGNKLSRDMLKASYRAYEQVCAMVIELIRQFYDAPRTFRITGKDGSMAFSTLDNSGMRPMAMQDEYGVASVRKPVFDLKIKAQRANPFSRASQNELAVQLYQMGVFNPQMADQSLMMLELMQFEGVDKLKQEIAQRGTVYEQMQQQIALLTQQLAALTGTVAALPEQPGDGQGAGAAQMTRAADGVSQAVRGAEEARRTDPGTEV